jgi:hypothetical protein
MLTEHSFYVYNLTMATKAEDVDVVSVRIPKDVLEQFDRIAEIERRSRASMIRTMMERADKIVTTTTRYLEWLVKTMEDLEAKYPNSPQLEFRRGQLHATKSMLSSFLGERLKDHTLNEVRKNTGLPIPHVISLDLDGNRYGFDSDAG